jgi:argininosuccinate synthase
MTPSELIDSVQTIARAHGIDAWTVTQATPAARTWRVDAPAAFVLDRARAALAARTFDERTSDFALTVAETYAGLVRDGGWFTPLREGLDALMARVLDMATGDVTVHVACGRIEVIE